ncbi:MAG: nitroreductase family protein, partial [Solirubrobacteraceae bacterium]
MRCAPSTRRFTDEPVSREVLERVLDNARYAPSGGNRQGWKV